jgi:hypothetical protein
MPSTYKKVAPDEPDATLMVMVFVPTTSAPAGIAYVYKMFYRHVSYKNHANTETHVPAPRPTGDTTRIRIVGDISRDGAGEGTNRDDGTATGKRQSRSYREDPGANCRCISAKMAWTVGTDALWNEVSTYVGHRLDEDRIKLRRRQQQLRPVKKRLRIGQVVVQK